MKLEGFEFSFRVTNFSINSFTDNVVTKVSGNQRLDVNIYYATIEITWNLNVSYYHQLHYTIHRATHVSVVILMSTMIKGD